MIKQLTCVAFAACLLTACSKGDGKAVSSPPSPGNAAVATDTHQQAADQTPGASSFTAAQAKGHLENAGYTDVGPLTQTPDGLWQGKASKDGKPTDVSVDFKGAITSH